MIDAALLDRLVEGCRVVGPDQRYVLLNEAASRQLGMARDALLGKTLPEAHPDAADSPLHAAIVASLEDRQSRALECPLESGGLYEVRIEPTPEGVAVLSVDIGERQKAEQRLTHVNSVLRGIRNVNQLITREKDPHLLVERACELLSEARGYNCAQIALIEDDGLHRVHCGAQEALPTHWSMLDRGEIPECGRAALESEGVVVRSDPASACPQCPAAGDYPERHDVICAALRHEGRTFGYISASVPFGLGADGEERDFFTEVAGDIAFALHSIEADRRREEAETRYEMLFREMLAGFALHEMIFDEDGEPADYRFLAVNPAFEQLTGLRAEHIVGKTVLEVLPGTERSWIERYGRVALTGRSDSFESYSGEMDRFFQVSAFRPAPGRFACVFVDISARRKSEDMCRREAERFRTTLYSIGDGVITTDRSGRIQMMNPVAERLTCWTEMDARRRPLAEVFRIVNEHTRAEAENPVAKVIRTGGIVGLANHTLLIARDGVERPIADSGAPVFGPDGEIEGIVLVFRDQSDERDSQRAIEASERQFRSLFELSPVSTIVHDKDTGEIVDANPAAIVSYGLSSMDELKSRDIWCEPPHSFEDALAWIRKAAAEGVQRFEWRTRGSGGEDLWESVHLAPVNIGGVDRVLATSIDITARVREAEEREKLQAQLMQAQKMEAVGRLAGGVAHDFNNMLGAIIGYTDVMLSSLNEGDPLREDLDQVKLAANRAAMLTRQLLAFSRKQVFEQKDVDLNAVVSGIEEMMRRLIGEDIELCIQPGAGIWTVKADPGQIEQVVMNLVVNSRDAMPNGGKITITTANVEVDEVSLPPQFDASAGSFVKLAVADDGAGMTQEVQRQVFEPFFTTKGVGEGTGLGLAMVYGIVKQSGGFIHFSSETGRGTVFEVFLPRTSLAGATVSDGVARGELADGAETVLLVEDEPVVRRLVQKILSRSGYDVMSAPNGTEALRLVDKHSGRIDLLITDVVMPGMSGKELADRFKLLHHETAVLFMSGYTDDAIVHHGVLAAGTNFIQKPFTASSLAAKVRQVLDQH